MLDSPILNWTVTDLGVVVLGPEDLHLDEGAEEAAPALAPAEVPRPQDPDAQVHGGGRGRRGRGRSSVPAAPEEIGD